MKSKFLILPLVACLLAFMACEEKNTESYPPTWKGLELSSKTVRSGDSIRATACQDMKGHLINATDYKWTLKVTLVSEDGTTKDIEESKSFHTNYDGTDNGDPSCTFVVPENAAGQGTIYFEATYHYSGSGIHVSSGDTYGNSSSMAGYIRSTSEYLYGHASGNATFRIIN